MIRSVKIGFLIFFICLASKGKALWQTNIQFSVVNGLSKIHINDTLFLGDDSTVCQITSLKFYISKIQLLKRHKIVAEDSIKFRLIDGSAENSFKILSNSKRKITFDELKFDLGIDSITNVSGAFGGDLDPTKGMYWTWQSGYINFKLEGRSKLCKTRNNEFQFHVGGYQKANSCLQTLRFSVATSDVISIKLDIMKIFENIDLTKTNRVMSPSAEAVSISKIIANAFLILEH
ncbi:MAG: MbnP family protein [Cytophagales bacterium]